jgi:hypothetical protein
MPSELTYYQDGNVTITNVRVILDSKTYATSNITSVSIGVIPPNRTIGIVIAVLGLGGAMCSYIGGSEIIGGVLIFGFGAFLAFIAKEKYTIKIGNTVGKSEALISNDKEYIQKIVSLINEAIST